MEYVLPFMLLPWDLKLLGAGMPRYSTHQLCDLRVVITSVSLTLLTCKISKLKSPSQDFNAIK